jgi:hypothetical protein
MAKKKLAAKAVITTQKSQNAVTGIKNAVTGAKRRPGRMKVDRPPHDALWLRTVLMVKGVSQVMIAEHLGTDKATVNHIVNGRRPMRDSDAIGIAELLKMPLSTFLDGVRGKTPVKV